jgi:hypothetical protein
MSVESGGPERPQRDPDPLRDFRDTWDIQTRRDGIGLWSALRRVGESTIHYVVSSSPEELARRLAAIQESEDS